MFKRKIHTQGGEKEILPNCGCNKSGGLEIALSNAAICWDDEMYARWSVKMWGLSSSMLIMDRPVDWLQRQVRRGSRGDRCWQRLWGWRESSSHKTSPPPASPILLAEAWPGNLQISVNTGGAKVGLQLWVHKTVFFPLYYNLFIFYVNMCKPTF